MAEKNYIWSGPPTAIEVVTPGKKEGDKPEIIFEGMAVPGQPIAKALPEDHDQVKAWLAFNLIKEQPEPAPKPNRKEPNHG